MLNAHPDPGLTFAAHELSRSPEWRRGFGLLARHDFVFDLQCYPNQFAEAAELAQAFPDTSIVIDHLGMPIARDVAGVALWRASVAPLAGCENVTMKVGGLGMIERVWTRDGIRPFVVGALELFGPDRCMFESNFPVEALFADVPTMVADCEAICLELGLGSAERDAFFAGTAERVYRI
jgi:predicted TIM-barrel fold metal-dependent hydrolase